MKCMMCTISDELAIGKINSLEPGKEEESIPLCKEHLIKMIRNCIEIKLQFTYYPIVYLDTIALGYVKPEEVPINVIK